MNVYDFDKTIYNGDSSIDFCLFCYKMQIKTILYVPKQIVMYLLYKMHLTTKVQAKEAFFSFLKAVKDVDNLVDKFWDCHEGKIHSWYKKQKSCEDVIISASPDFLLDPLMDRLQISNIIATKVSKVNGVFLSKNCYGVEKVNRYREIYDDVIPDNFYSDSQTDGPMMKISKKSFLVKKSKLEEWK